MNFLKKPPVAIVLTLLIVALCCVLGYTRAMPGELPEGEAGPVSHRAGESNMNYYLGWIDDGAAYFSLSTVDTLARYDLNLDNEYDSLVAVKSVWHLSGMDIDVYAQNTADRLNLGNRDILLLLDDNTQDWYVTYGGGIRSYVEADDSLAQLLGQHLGEKFFAEGADRNQEILALFGNLENWYANHVPAVAGAHDPVFHFSGKSDGASLEGVVKGILFALLANGWWILLLFLLLYVLDSVRFHWWFRRRADGKENRRFHPFLFWHAAGSAWYEKMFLQEEGDLEVEEFEFEEDDELLGPDGPEAGAGGGGYRHGPGYSTDPNEPGPFSPQYSTDPNEPGPFGPSSAP